MSQLISGTPVGHPLIQRIQDRIATLGSIELRRVVECRVVDNRRLATLLNLKENSSDQSALAGAGVTHDEDVIGFDCYGESDARHSAEQPLHERSFRQLEADAIGLIPAIENSRRD